MLMLLFSYLVVVAFYGMNSVRPFSIGIYCSVSLYDWE